MNAGDEIRAIQRQLSDLNRRLISVRASGGGGEANTASNVGAGGIGVFNAKVGIDLQFRNINAASARISVAHDAPNKEVDIDVVEAQINHDALLNYAANQHVVLPGIIANVLTDHNLANHVLGTIVPHDTLNGLTDLNVPAPNNNDFLTWDAGTNKWIAEAGGGGAATFLDLTDTPAAYFGGANKFVKVNAGADALEFVTQSFITTFLGLTDTPGSYFGEASKFVKVNAGANALEFVAQSFITTFLGLTDTPASYWGYGGKYVKVNAGGDALEFGD